MAAVSALIAMASRRAADGRSAPCPTRRKLSSRTHSLALRFCFFSLHEVWNESRRPRQRFSGPATPNAQRKRARPLRNAPLPLRPSRLSLEDPGLEELVADFDAVGPRRVQLEQVLLEEPVAGGGR